jgi:ATP:cob(I)alamin adenosyltransferase
MQVIARTTAHSWSVRVRLAVPATAAYHSFVTAAQQSLNLRCAPLHLLPSRSPLHHPVRAMSSDSSSTVAASASSGSSDDIYTGGKYRVYTKTGDKGTTSLFNMERRSKGDDYFQALGDTDELNANLGVVRAHCATVVNSTGGDEGDAAHRDACAQLDEQLSEVQSRLFDVGAHLATPRSASNAAQKARTEFEAHHVETLEHWIDGMETVLSPLKNFILPSGGLVASQLHVCRAVCRRAERSSVPLVGREDADPVVARYLNRLSDYLFVAARFAALAARQPDTIWRKPRPPRAPRTPSPSPDKE